MTPLQEILYQFAEEQLVTRCCRDTLPQLRRAERESALLARRLENRDAETRRRVNKLCTARDTMETLHAQASFLAGLSVGLELGGLCYGA